MSQQRIRVRIRRPDRRPGPQALDLRTPGGRELPF